MNDIESRLRAAMHAAVELPAPGLVDRVRRAHRRHLRRMAAGWVASVAAVAIAVPPVAGALHSSVSRPGPTGVSPAAVIPAPSASPAPGTVLSGCAAANVGQLGTTWRNDAVRLGASPLWVIDGGHGVANNSNTAPSSADKVVLGVGVMVVAGIRAGSVVVVRVAPAGRPYLRFLYGPGDSLDPGTKYTMASGESGVTFVSCSAGGFYPARDNATNYYGGFLTLGQRCVPVDISWTGHSTPARVDFGTC